MDPTELFIETKSNIQIHCTEATRNKFHRIATGTTIYQIDGDAGLYTYDGDSWIKHADPTIEDTFTDEDVSNIKKIPELCTLADVIQYFTDNKDIFETISALSAKYNSKIDKEEVYTKSEIDRKLLTLSTSPTKSLKNRTGSVTVNTSKPPFTNQVLTAISKDQAIWADPHIPVSYVMYLQIIARLEELERYQRENEAKKRLSVKPKPPSKPSIIFK